MKNIEDLSVIDLLHEFIRDGSAELLNSEPLEIEKIVAQLEMKTGQNFGPDLEKWIKWFCSSNTDFPLSDKESIQSIKRIVDMEKHYIPKIKGSK